MQRMTVDLFNKRCGMPRLARFAAGAPQTTREARVLPGIISRKYAFMAPLSLRAPERAS
jgi:hypothetical protein